MSRLRRAVACVLDITPWLRLPVGVKQAAKKSIALTMNCTGLSWLAHRYQVARKSPFIRAVNYHDVAPSNAARFERQLRFFKKRFVPVGYPELLAFCEGRWPHDKPGIVVCFDDGLKSQAQVAAPLLEKHGFVGWFFVPVAFVDTPPERHAEYGEAHRIAWSRSPGEDLGAMSWDDVRRLDRRHVIGCHTYTHVRLAVDLTAEQLDLEIRQAKQRLEQELKHRVEVFCWVGGEEWSYSSAAARAIREAGFRVSFINTDGVIRPGMDLHQLNRTCVEAFHPMWFVRYSLSGFLDLVYRAQRERILRVVSATGADDPALACGSS